MLAAFLCVLALTVLSASGDVCSAYNNCDKKNCSFPDDINSDAITNLGHSDPALKQFQANMHAAAKILKDVGPTSSIDFGLLLHTTVAYLCCYSLPMLEKIADVYEKVQWDPVNITFSHIICNTDSPDHISFIVVMDPPSQQRMMALVQQFEIAMTAAGIPVHRPRSSQEPFHSTLGVVHSSYPVATALQRINASIPVFSSIPYAFKQFALELPYREIHARTV